MTDILTHTQARALTQTAHLHEDDRIALREHLATCDECRRYAAMHLRLLRELPQPATRPQPTAAQRAAILGAAKRSAPARRGPMHLTSLAGLAAMCLLVVAGWLLIRPAQPSATASPPPRWSTLVAIFLPEASPTPVATPAAAATPDPRGRYVIASVPAPSLAGNAIGEPLEQEVIVYLPPSYDQGDRRYPVVYALSPTTRKDATRFDTQVAELRSAVALGLSAGMMPEMIIVVPDSLNALNATNFFVSSPTVGNWEAFLATDLVNYIDANYRTIPDAHGRGLLGIACNGLPALWTAMRHPDVFSAVYMQRPLVLPPGVLAQSDYASPIARSVVNDLLDEAAGLSAADTQALIRERLGGIGMPFAAQESVAYGLAFAPATNAPYFEYPYAAGPSPADAATLARWENGLGNVPTQLQPYRQTLSGLQIAVSYLEGEVGFMVTNDEGPAYLSEQLTALGIPHRFAVTDTPEVVEMGRAVLPFFAEVLVSE